MARFTEARSVAFTPEVAAEIEQIAREEESTAAQVIRSLVASALASRSLAA